MSVRHYHVGLVIYLPQHGHVGNRLPVQDQGLSNDVRHKNVVLYLGIGLVVPQDIVHRHRSQEFWLTEQSRKYLVGIQCFPSFRKLEKHSEFGIFAENF